MPAYLIKYKGSHYKLAGIPNLEWTGETTFMGGKVYKLSVALDLFVHFTTPSRAQEILKRGLLLMRPPYKKFGTDTVNAVSALYGSYTPGVQTSHLGEEAAQVAVVFRTTLPPNYGYVEEVVWDSDVPLKYPEVVDVPTAIALLNSSPVVIGDQDMVVYSEDTA